MFLLCRVAGVKSHSWSSSHMTSVLPDRRDSSADHGASTSHRGTALFKPTLWISKAGQWTHLQTGRWHKTIASYRSIYSEHWATLRQKRLQLLRYSASACFLLAALISLIVTFVPSSLSGSSSSAANGSSTVMPPPGRTGRWICPSPSLIIKALFLRHDRWHVYDIFQSLSFIPIITMCNHRHLFLNFFTYGPPSSFTSFIVSESLAVTEPARWISLTESWQIIIIILEW